MKVSYVQVENHCGKYQCPSKERQYKLERGQDMKKRGCNRLLSGEGSSTYAVP